MLEKNKKNFFECLRKRRKLQRKGEERDRKEGKEGNR